MMILIFAVGLLIYGGYGMVGLLYLLGTTLISYLAGLLIPKRKWVLWISVALHAGMLVLIRLQPYTGMELPAIMGVSYFTLSVLSYNADIYRGKYLPERNLFYYAAYVTYIPRLFIGPNERYDTMKKAMFDDRRMTWDGVFNGAVRAMWGLFKKLCIASRVGVIVSAISADPQTYQGGYALLAMLLYSVQLYCDFSGGIDTVIGVSRMLGVRLSENFDTPYFSQTFQEFWRRWHITLGAWLRDYVYIPLGGNRKGVVRKYLNTLVTFLVSGFWHGASYWLWGLLNGVFVCVGNAFKTPFKTLNRVMMFLTVSLLWSFFVWPEWQTSLQMLISVATVWNYDTLIAGVAAMGLTAGDWIVLAASALILWGYDIWHVRINAAVAKRSFAFKTIVLALLTLTVAVFGMYGIGFEAESFIYSRF